jgi:hypothetical protein
MHREDPEMAAELPTEQLRGSSLEALLDESKVNAEQVSTAGEKKYVSLYVLRPRSEDYAWL